MRAVTSGPCRWSSFALLFLILALAVSVVPTSAWAQAVNSGNVNGQVTDPQGAVVPGAKITLTNPLTSTTFTATTNDEGRYFLANVPPATYDVTATKSGFATAKITAQTVSVGTTSTVDVKMTVGEVSTTVEVQATNTELQTMNATIGNTVPPVAITSLPAMGLDVSTFAVLQPGVSPGGQTAGTQVDQSAFMLDGGNNTNDMDGSMTVYTGSFTGDPSGGVTGNGGLPSGVVPTPADSVEEIKTNTTNQTADFNSSSGMQVQIVTKRGTNKWHGTAYEYYLDNNFSANSWQNNCSTACGKSYTPQPDWHRSWFGIAGGGPLITKRILGGKTYFFANYQGTRWHNSTTATKTVPGPGMLQGLLEFSNNGVISVYNLNPTATVYKGPTLTGKCGKCGLINGTSYPVGASTVTGAPVDPTALDPRNLGINTAVNPVSQMWNKYVPQLLALPGYNYGGGAGDGNTFAYTATEALPYSDNFGVARLDHDFGDKWHFFGSYRYYRLINQVSTQSDIGGFLGGAVGVPTSVSAVPQVPWFYVAGLTTNLTPTTTNDFHWSFTRNWWAWNRAGDPAQLSGLGGALEPGGETSSSLAPYNVNTQNTRTRFWDGLDNMFRDDVTSLHGNHLLQFGGTYQRNHDKHHRTDNGGGINYYPVYQIGSSSKAVNVATATLPSNISSSNVSNYAKEYNEILGIMNTSQIAYTRSGANLSLNPPLTPAGEDSIIPFYNVYFSDSWHMKPSFTLTYGLGWTMEMPPVDKNGNIIVAVDSSDQQLNVESYLKARQQAALQGQAYNPAIGFALLGNSSGGTQKYPYNPFYGEFSPRIAAAWNPDFGDSFLGRHLFGGKSTVIRGGYGRIYGRLNGVDLVLVPLLGTGLIQPVQCFNPTFAGGAQSCGQNQATAATAFRMGKDGLTAPLAAASPTLPQPDFPGISVCGPAGAICAAAGAGEGFDPNFRPNVTDSFTLSIQRQIGQHNTLEIGYIGRLIRNEYLPLNTNAVPYMFTKGGQQFQSAYANVEKALGCATSAAACGAAVPSNLSVNGAVNGTPCSKLSATCLPNPGYGNYINGIASQPFFSAAMTPGFCSGTFSNGTGAYANCTAAVVDNELSNFLGQNVWSLWGDLDQGSNGVAAYNGCNSVNSTSAGICGFAFPATMQSSPGAGGAPQGCPTCSGFQLSSGLGLNASVGYGNYHAGFVSWRMANWHGLTSQSNFTWGKALGTNSEVQASSELTADDPYRLQTNYGLQPWDRKFVFNTFLVYETPWFKGQQGIIGRLLGGWNIAPIFSTGSGFDEGCVATFGGTTAQAFGSADGTNYFDTEQCVPTGPIPVQKRYAGVKGGTDSAGNGIANNTYPGANVQFNAFANPLAVWNNIRPAILGIDNVTGDNSGTGLLRGMGFWNVDLSVKKNFKLTERFSATFQTVFTNVFNHNQFSDASIDLSNPGCLGVLTASCAVSGGPQISNPRQIELSLRINF